MQVCQYYKLPQSFQGTRSLLRPDSRNKSMMGKAKTTTTKNHQKKNPPHTPTQDYCDHYHTWALTTWNIFNIQLQDAAWAWASSDHITSSSDLSSVRDTDFNTEKSHWTKWKQTQLGSGKSLAPLDRTTDHLRLELRLWGRWPRGGALDDRSLLEGVASCQLALPLGLPLVACPVTHGDSGHQHCLCWKLL